MKTTHVARSLTGLAAALVLTIGCGASAVTPPAASPSPRDSGEVWLTLQASSKLVILRGRRDQPERSTIDLPAGTGPHITTFSPDGRYAYVGGMGNGDLDVLDADSRQVAATLHLGPAGTHQVKPSPDGTALLAAQVATQSLIKVAADMAHQQWSVAGALSFAQLRVAPVCSVFRKDGRRAYVSLNPTGLAVVDVDTMTLVETLPVAGFIACGMVAAPDGRSVMIASSGGGGHIYRLDTTTDRLDDMGALGASDWHSFNTTPDQKLGVGSAPTADQVLLVDLTGGHAQPVANLPVRTSPDPASAQPDAIGIRGSTAWVSLRKSGKVAVIDLARRAVVTYLDVAPAAETINFANCAGCAIHGVTVRR